MIQVKSREDFNLPSILTKLKPNNLNKAHSPLSLSQFRAGLSKLKPNIFKLFLNQPLTIAKRLN